MYAGFFLTAGDFSKISIKNKILLLRSLMAFTEELIDVDTVDFLAFWSTALVTWSTAILSSSD